MKKIKDKQDGFTLIEVLVAMTILASVIIPLSNSFIKSSQIISKARKKTVALNLARLKLEKELGAGEIDSKGLTRIEDSDFSNYFYEVKINAIETNIKELIVEVYWKGEDSLAQLVTLVSF